MKTCRGMTAAAAGLVPVAAFADQGDGHYGPHMWGEEGSWWFMGHGLMALFWIALIILAVLAVRAVMDRPRSGGTGEDDAIAILRERFARGEIDQAQFDERRKALES